MPDVAAIPECADVSTLRAEAPMYMPRSFAWVGDDPNHGLGIAGYGEFKVRLDEAFDNSMTWIAPVQVTGPIDFHLLAVWAVHESDGETSDEVVGPLLRALDAYDEFCRAMPLVVAGDFNNHVRWDRPNKANNQRRLVDRLGELGLMSAYHERGQVVEQGCETDATFFHRKSLDSPYHIDYCFVPKSWGIHACEIGKPADWLSLSDHMPIKVEVVPR